MVEEVVAQVSDHKLVIFKAEIKTQDKMTHCNLFKKHIQRNVTCNWFMLTLVSQEHLRDRLHTSYRC